MLDHLDMEGLSPAQARQYVLDHISTLKRTQAERKKLADELSTWKPRVDLAKKKGRDDLAEKAAQIVADTETKLKVILTEERELEFQVMELKEKLKKLQGQPSRSVDAEALLAQLQGVVGVPDAVEEELADTALDAELERLKKNLGQD